MLGTMIGDVLGAPFEGAPAEYVRACWGSKQQVCERIEHARYTDDTQMMIGVAESLIACGGFDGAHMARRFAENYEPHRGYGAGAHQVLQALRDGCPWDQAATLVFPEGSFGNGAAMRVAPVGLFWHNEPSELRRVAELSASITHGHPLGKEGSALQAYAVACAVCHRPKEMAPGRYLANLRAFVRPDCEVFGRKLLAIGELLDSEPSVEQVVAELGNDVRAFTAVPAAIYAFLSHAHSFSEAVTYAVQLGGDTDTIGAMAGAIAGALHGLSGIPAAWVPALANNAQERDNILGLSTLLYRRHVEQDSA
jgi:poly(ADP-ribose) glycohydrolase ARH3